MGHAVNPVALRLTNSRDWPHSFMTHGKFYPELLHSTFYVRKIADELFISPFFYTMVMLTVIV